MTVVKPDKPLGRKAYGSIGHITGSRLGPGDHSVNDGQSAICTTSAPGRSVWAQTKLDGSCVAAALVDGELVALGRAGYPARSSKYEMHHVWADWVDANAHRFRSLLAPGERVVGEWLAQAHGTRYDLRGREPFVAFDIMVAAERVTWPAFRSRVEGVFAVPPTMAGPVHPIEAMQVLDRYGADEPEGVVYRVESRKHGVERVDFLAKWVRADKVDGSLLDGDPVWNWHPSKSTLSDGGGS